MRRDSGLTTPTALAAAVVLGVAAAGCSKPAPEIRKGPETPASASATAPMKKGLYVTLDTTQGEIVARLLPEEAPKTVENFVGLATGKKEWTDPATGQKTTRPLYNGTHFFRVIPGFMIQGGDPLSSGFGNPGFRFEDEFFPGRTFDRAGLLAMANSGPDTNGSQFFITLAPVPHLTNKHTIFGEVVKGQDVVGAIAAVERTRMDPQTGRVIDRPAVPQVLKEVRIEER
ncbi:MAG: peptidylprolyl isomerase [Elusimicrobiota bacterium]